MIIDSEWVNFVREMYDQGFDIDITRLVNVTEPRHIDLPTQFAYSDVSVLAVCNHKVGGMQVFICSPDGYDIGDFIKHPEKLIGEYNNRIASKQVKL